MVAMGFYVCYDIDAEFLYSVLFRGLPYKSEAQNLPDGKTIDPWKPTFHFCPLSRKFDTPKRETQFA